jgi:superfamily II DNA/RNA helicase
MPAAFLAGGQPQAERMNTLEAVRDFRLRLIVSTDLVSTPTPGATGVTRFSGRAVLGLVALEGSVSWFVGFTHARSLLPLNLSEARSVTLPKWTTVSHPPPTLLWAVHASWTTLDRRAGCLRLMPCS